MTTAEPTPGITEVSIAAASTERDVTWALVQGEATVFLADLSANTAGRRSAVATVLAPAVIALPTAPEGFGWVVARSRGETLPFADAKSAGAISPEAYVATAEVLLDVVRGSVVPPSDRINRIGSRPVFVSAGRSALVDHLAWVRPVEGEPQLAGIALPAAGAPLGSHLPVADPSGFFAVVASDFAARDDDSMIDGLRWLWSVAGECTLRQRETQQADDHQRVSNHGVAERATEEAAVRLLAREITNAGTPAPVMHPDPLIACAALVGQYAGFSVQAPRGGLRGREGTSAVRAIATASGLYVRTVTLEPGWSRAAVEPMIGFQPDGTPMALVFNDGSGRLIDQHGNEFPAESDSSPTLINKAFVLTQPPTEPLVTPWSLIRGSLRGQRRSIGLSLTWSLVIALVSLTVPLASGVVFGEIIPSGDTSRLIWLIVALIAAALAVLPVQVAASAADTRLEASFALNLQRGIWGRVLRSPVTLVKRFGPGDLTVRLSALESGRDMIDQSVLAPMPVMMSALVSVFVLFFYDATLAWFALGWGLVVMAVSITLAFRVSKAQAEVDRATGDVNGFLFQVLGAMPKLHVAGAEARAFAAWAERFRGAVGQRLTTRSAQQVLIGGVVSTGSTVVLFGAVALTGNIHQVGAFIAFQTTFSLFLGGIAAFTGALASIIQLKPSFERAAELANDTSESGAGRVDPGSLRGDVSLRNVSFRYQPDTPMILNGLDLDIRAGEMVAIVGHSGCGKSTILRMLLGFEQPEQGSVMFDNQDLATLDVGSVRRQLGVVLQDGQLMPGSIFQNLAGSATISESDAWELAEIVALADDIKAMPMKLETMITMNGGAFSGGQRQRLLIARALASRPRILLLDEATSALDNVTQRIVTRNLAEVGMTRIVVAHRLSTIIDADRIVVLDHGAVAEHGTYDQLMAQGGAFHALATRQVV